MTVSERIFLLLKEKKLTAKDLGEYIDVKPSSISAWKNEGSYPSSKYIVRISEFLNVSLEYLLTGKEKSSPAELTADEQELLTYYKNLMEIDKGKLLERAKMMSEQDEHHAIIHTVTSQQVAPDQRCEVAETDSEKLYIEIYSLPVSAGNGVYLDGHDKELLEVDYSPLTTRANFALMVKGDSMVPKFFDEDIILIETQPCVEVGEIGVFILNDEGYVKKFGGDRLISLNAKYPDIIIHEYDSFYCKGRVIGKL